LVELFIVVSLMAVLAGLVIPSFMPDLTQRLDSTADVVAADLAWARSLAVTNNSTYRVTFNAAAGEYSLEHTGASAALDILPRSAFGRYSDPADVLTTRFKDLPNLGPTARIYTVVKQTASGSETAVTDLEFGPLGGTTRPETTIVWLAAGQGTALRFLPLTIDPVTGLVTIGAMTNVAPGSLAAGASTPSGGTGG
jgi:type II secretory pathway pseudopilin PulG